MKHLFPLILLPVFLFCTGSNGKSDRIELSAVEELQSLVSYDSVRNEMSAKRLYFSTQYAKAKSDSARNLVVEESRKYMVTTFTEKVFPCWYGTKWAFSGITEKPREDYIACGYLVSTTLKHAGYKVNRYKLAQQAAALIAKSVSGPGNITTLRTIPEVVNHMKKEPEGLYVLGLDYHVGFLLKERDSLYFIHSNYLPPRQVTREKFADSEAVKLSDIFVTGEIFTEGNLLKWLKQEEIVVFTR